MFEFILNPFICTDQDSLLWLCEMYPYATLLLAFSPAIRTEMFPFILATVPCFIPCSDQDSFSWLSEMYPYHNVFLLYLQQFGPVAFKQTYSIHLSLASLVVVEFLIVSLILLMRFANFQS
jgi:hypothetical protein